LLIRRKLIKWIKKKKYAATSITADTINCFFNLTTQYTPNKKVSAIRGDTPRLSNDKLENCFGGR
jgi:hypothetical protein